MPSGKPIDWTLYDQIIIDELPNTTVKALAEKFKVCSTALVRRAKILGVKHGKYVLGTAQKSSISQRFKKQLSSEQKQFIIDNYQVIARKAMAKQLGVSYYLVKTFMSENNLTQPSDVIYKALSEHGKKMGSTGSIALKLKIQNDPVFATKLSEASSKRCKLMWTDEIYRLKVRNGMRTAYETTDLRDRLSVSAKERYNSDPTVREILLAPRQFKNSKLNDDVASVLDGYGIKYEREVAISNFTFDFKIDDVLLEVNGDYWHSLPDNIRNDRSKSTLINTYYPSYKLRVLWEREFRSVRGKDRLLEVLDVIKKEPVIIDLNAVKFSCVDKTQLINTFLSSFHYLGQTNRCKHSYGAYLHGELIAVATFGQLVRQNISKTRSIELTRLCRHPYFHNKNLMSKFLGWCCREIKKHKLYDRIISYADTSVHVGTIYKASNWIDCGLCEPDYQYMSATNVPMHKKTLYNRAKSANMTEREYAEANDFSKIVAGRKQRFEFPLV